MSCLYACAYVWAGVCGCVWLRLIRSSWESSPLGYISSCHALSLVRSLQFAVDVYEAFLVPGFRDSWALLLSWTPIAGDSSAHCFPALPASAPTESSVSAYGKLRFCLRRAPRLPTEAPPLCLRKAPFSFSLCITSCNKLSFSATESSRLHCDNESRFLLWHSDGRVRICHIEHESMDPSCFVSTVQAGGGGVMVWGIFSWHTLGPLVLIEHHLNTTAYLSIVAGD